jgi:GINS complex subunit 1
MQSLYGDLGLSLVKEAKRSQVCNTLQPYRSDIIRDIQFESQYLQSGLTRSSTVKALAIQCLKRSKRCVLAYMQTNNSYQLQRLNRIKHQWWLEGGSSSSKLTCSTNISKHEEEFLKGYVNAVMSVKEEWLDIDLVGNMLPPKSVFCEIRVLDDCGVRMSEYGPVRLAQGTQHYVKVATVLDLIQRGSVIKL